ncbi:MAG TPA: cyclase family protein [Steroidobacteraceae bacterium]
MRSRSKDRLWLQSGDDRWVAHLDRPLDLSIPLHFDGAQPTFFNAPAASATALTGGSFVGDVRRSGSCNCSSYTLAPHCNGTHTECVGHVTADRVSVRDIAIDHLVPALLLTVQPESSDATDESSDPPAQAGDRLITARSLAKAIGDNDEFAACRALIIRTLPNTSDKLERDYSAGALPPYFSVAAMQWIVARGIDHLVVDLPSVDRSHDAGKLTAHRVFWGIPAGTSDSAAALRRHATITEMAYAEDSIHDGAYLLNLQIAPFEADAAPSRPILYPLEKA